MHIILDSEVQFLGDFLHVSFLVIAEPLEIRGPGDESLYQLVLFIHSCSAFQSMISTIHFHKYFLF